MLVCLSHSNPGCTRRTPPFRFRPTQATGGTSASLAGGAEADGRLPRPKQWFLIGFRPDIDQRWRAIRTPSAAGLDSPSVGSVNVVTGGCVAVDGGSGVHGSALPRRRRRSRALGITMEMVNGCCRRFRWDGARRGEVSGLNPIKNHCFGRGRRPSASAPPASEADVPPVAWVGRKRNGGVRRVHPGFE